MVFKIIAVCHCLREIHTKSKGNKSFILWHDEVSDKYSSLYRSLKWICLICHDRDYCSRDTVLESLVEVKGI